VAERFVILLHTGYADDHYDLMLCCGQLLATWRTETNPAALAVGECIPALRLIDHRTEYLTYEGPVTGGRGHVRRTGEGNYQVIYRQDDCWIIRLEGTSVGGRFELRQSGPGDDQWRLTRQLD